MVGRSPASAAACRAVTPPSAGRFGFAPLAARARTTSVFPDAAAISIAPTSSDVSAFASAPAPSKHSTARQLPEPAAQSRGVPAVDGASIAAPASSSAFRTSSPPAKRPHTKFIMHVGVIVAYFRLLLARLLTSRGSPMQGLWVRRCRERRLGSSSQEQTDGLEVVCACCKAEGSLTCRLQLSQSDGRLLKNLYRLSSRILPGMPD